MSLNIVLHIYYPVSPRWDAHAIRRSFIFIKTICWATKGCGMNFGLNGLDFVVVTNPILPSIPKETFHLTSVSHSHAISSLFPYPCSSSAQPYWMTGSHLILLRPSAFDLYYIKGINSLSLFLSSSVWVCAVVLCRCCSAFFFHRDSKWKGGFGNIKCCLMMAFSWNEMKVGQERRARALGLFFVCGGSIVDWQRNRKIRCQIPFAGNS